MSDLEGLTPQDAADSGRRRTASQTVAGVAFENLNVAGGISCGGSLSWAC